MPTARALSFELRIKDPEHALADFRSVGSAANDTINRAGSPVGAHVSNAAAGYRTALPPWVDSTEIKTLLSAGDIGMEPYEAANAARWRPRPESVCEDRSADLCAHYKGR